MSELGVRCCIVCGVQYGKPHFPRCPRYVPVSDEVHYLNDEITALREQLAEAKKELEIAIADKVRQILKAAEYKVQADTSHSNGRKEAAERIIEIVDRHGEKYIRVTIDGIDK